MCPCAQNGHMGWCSQPCWPWSPVPGPFSWVADQRTAEKSSNMSVFAEQPDCGLRGVAAAHRCKSSPPLPSTLGVLTRAFRRPSCRRARLMARGGFGPFVLAASSSRGCCRRFPRPLPGCRDALQEARPKLAVGCSNDNSEHSHQQLLDSGPGWCRRLRCDWPVCPTDPADGPKPLESCPGGICWRRGGMPHWSWKRDPTA